MMHHHGQAVVVVYWVLCVWRADAEQGAVLGGRHSCSLRIHLGREEEKKAGRTGGSVVNAACEPALTKHVYITTSSTHATLRWSVPAAASSPTAVMLLRGGSG